LASYSILVYDWLTTFDAEVELIHKTGWSLIKILFLLCRYCPLVLLAIINTLYIGDFTEEFCKGGVQPAYILFIPLHIFPQAVVAVRAYAFSGRKRWVLWSLGLCFLALCSVVIFAFHEAVPYRAKGISTLRKQDASLITGMSRPRKGLAWHYLLSPLSISSLWALLFFTVIEVHYGVGNSQDISPLKDSLPSQSLHSLIYSPSSYFL